MITVRPLRFTAASTEMKTFLETLGLRVAVESKGGVWFDLRGAHGGAAVHPVEGADTDVHEGMTTLSFEVSDPEALVERLRAAGRADTTVWDEAYGRVIGLDDPHGTQLWLDVEQDDLYGYRATGETFGGDIDVTPVVFTHDIPAWLRLLADLGAEIVHESPGFTAVAFPGTGGGVGVHEAPEGQTDGAVVELAFQTATPLDRIARRVQAGGYPAEMVTDGFGPDFLAVTDPNGKRLEIYPR